MRIGGLLKFSLIDYPGKVAAVIFTQGCNFRCGYCHNPELVLPQCFHKPMEEKEVLAFLKKRAGQIQGVVVTGGEPTIHSDLINFLRKIKALNYCIKLDTNGSHPDVLRKICALELVDTIAMDIKAPLEKYAQLTEVGDHARRISQSIRVILSSGLNHEFRTTLVRPLHSAEDLSSMASLIKGAKKYRLQRFICRDTILDKNLCAGDVPQFSQDEVTRLQSLYGI